MKVRAGIAVALAAFGVWEFGGGAYLHAKAWLAQRMIASAWVHTLAGDRNVRPWPWADTWPVARLRAPAVGADLYVLADASGRSLAFGPGYMQGSVEPGAVGSTMIAGHRDTHFEFLRHLSRGAEISLQTADGRLHRYRFTDAYVLDIRHERLRTDVERPVLTLITCYPFDALVPGGPLRFVVVAEGLPPP